MLISFLGAKLQSYRTNVRINNSRNNYGNNYGRNNYAPI